MAGGAGRNPEGPTARFSNLPANHDGTTAFTVELHFSAEPEGLSYSTVAGGMLEVEGGAVTRAERATRGSNMGWRVTVAPSGEGDVEIELPARKCGKPNAVCIGGRPLERAAQATVAGTASVEPPPPPEPPTPPEVPLTASFSGAPAEHAGSGSFELQFRLSEEPAGLSYRTVQSGLFNVTGASIGRAWRLQKGRPTTGWGLRVEPSGFGDVTLVVRATTDCAGTPGVCTSDERMLGGGLQSEDCRAAHAFGGRCRGRRERGRDARLRRHPEPGAQRNRDGRVRDRRCQRERGSGLHEHERHAHLRGTGDLEDGLGAGARRRARRGLGDDDAEALEPEPRHG